MIKNNGNVLLHSRCLCGFPLELVVILERSKIRKPTLMGRIPVVPVGYTLTGRFKMHSYRNSPPVLLV